MLADENPRALQTRGHCRWSVGLEFRADRILQNSIEEITAPLKGSRFDLYAQFTPAEIKIAEFLKLGLSSKEISRLLGISDRTVQVHCLKIREKLGIKNKKVNLKGHLMSL